MASYGDARAKRTVYPVFVHRLLRRFLLRAGHLRGVWRLRAYLLDTARVGFPDRPVRVALRFGPKIWLDPNEGIARHIFYTGIWEDRVATHFVQHLRVGDTVLDVGANIGQYTLLAAAKVGCSGKVYSVEASDSEATFLHHNVSLNEFANVRVLQLAAWDRQTTLHLGTGEPFNRGAAQVNELATDPASVQVQAARLDEVLPEEGCDQIDVIKMDIEGSELPALRGLVRLFEKRLPRLIYCEIAPLCHRLGYTQGDLVHFLSSYGYKAWVFSDDGLVRLEQDMIEGDFVAMVVFAFADSEVLLEC